MTIKFVKAPKNSYNDSCYEFKCQECDLEEYDNANLDIDDNDNNHQGCDNEEKCVEAWKVWFTEAIQMAKDSKNVPEWLVYL